MSTKVQSFILHIRKIGLFQTLSYLIQRKLKKSDKLLKIKVKGLKYKVLLRNGTYDTHIFNQIFIREEVNFKLSFEPEIIIDCGANIGLSTLYFKSIYPECKILSFEPERSNYNLLFLNTNNYEGIVIEKAAIWFEETTINVVDIGEGNASFQTSAASSEKVIGTIEAKSINSIMKQNGYKAIDLIKIDIEGSEYEIFSHSCEEWIDRSAVIAVEIHEGLKPGVTSLITEKMNNKFEKKQMGEYEVFFKKEVK